MSKSAYVCRTCWLPLTVVGVAGMEGATIFKHAASGSTGPGCGKPPDPYTREEHEAEVLAHQSAFDHAMGRDR